MNIILIMYLVFLCNAILYHNPNNHWAAKGLYLLGMVICLVSILKDALT